MQESDIGNSEIDVTALQFIITAKPLICDETLAHLVQVPYIEFHNFLSNQNLKHYSHPSMELALLLLHRCNVGCLKHEYYGLIIAFLCQLGIRSVLDMVGNENVITVFLYYRGGY